MDTCTEYASADPCLSMSRHARVPRPNWRVRFRHVLPHVHEIPASEAACSRLCFQRGMLRSCANVEQIQMYFNLNACLYSTGVGRALRTMLKMQSRWDPTHGEDRAARAKPVMPVPSLNYIRKGFRHAVGEVIVILAVHNASSTGMTRR